MLRVLVARRPLTQLNKSHFFTLRSRDWSVLKRRGGLYLGLCGSWGQSSCCCRGNAALHQIQLHHSPLINVSLPPLYAIVVISPPWIRERISLMKTDMHIYTQTVNTHTVHVYIPSGSSASIFSAFSLLTRSPSSLAPLGSNLSPSALKGTWDRSKCTQTYKVSHKIPSRYSKNVSKLLLQIHLKGRGVALDFFCIHGFWRTEEDRIRAAL